MTDLTTRIARIEELDKKRIEAMVAHQERVSANGGSMWLTPEYSASLPKQDAQRDEMLSIIRELRGKPAVEGKPIEIQTRDELLYLVRELKAENEALKHPPLIAETDDDGNIIRVVPLEYHLLKQAVVILPDGAEPRGGDIVINKAGWPKPICKIEDNVAYWAEHGKYHGCSIYDCKIIQRHGLPVIYQSALQPKQEMK